MTIFGFSGGVSRKLPKNIPDFLQNTPLYFRVNFHTIQINRKYLFYYIITYRRIFLMSRTAIPSSYPAEGTYNFSTIHVDLSSATPGARIHYTMDGSEPDENSPVYCRDNGLLHLEGVHGDSVSCTLKAYAQADGMERSRTVTFTYRFNCFPKGYFRHTMLREPADDCPGLMCIEDHDLDRMFLVIGTKRAVLIDAGWSREGDLPELCRELVGRDIPIDLVVGHGHLDHIMQVENFLAAGCKVYLPSKDLELAASFDVHPAPGSTLDLTEGMKLDLGNACLTVYEVPGHTPGGVVLLDEKNGDLYASDELGSCRRYVPDSAFLQLEPAFSLETNLRTLEAFMKKTEGKVKRIFTGHNDDILDGPRYLATLHSAMKKAVEGGEDALRPSYRCAAESLGSGTIAWEGDWRYDPYWTAINLRFLYDRDRDAVPPKYVKGFQPELAKFDDFLEK